MLGVSLWHLLTAERFATPWWLRRWREGRLRRLVAKLEPLEGAYHAWVRDPPLGTVVRDTKRRHQHPGDRLSFTRVGEITQFPRPTFEEEFGPGMLFVNFVRTYENAENHSGLVHEEQTVIPFAECLSGQYELERMDTFSQQDELERLRTKVAKLRRQLGDTATG